MISRACGNPAAMKKGNKQCLLDTPRTVRVGEMKKVNKQCLLDTPRTVRVSEKTWQVIVRTRRP